MSVGRGMTGGLVAAVVSGAPSTVHTLLAGGDLTESTRAAGTLIVPDDAPPPLQLAAGVATHLALSVGWGGVLGLVLPRRRPVAWGALAGLGIAALDLAGAGRRFRAVEALPTAPQVADHLVFGATVGWWLGRAPVPAG